MSLITIIGRGHSGTRAISHTLYASGVYMGRLLNRGHVDRGDSEYSSVFFLQLLLGVVMMTGCYMI